MADNKARNAMFRRKDEDSQEETKTMASSNNNQDGQNNRPAGAYNSDNNNANRPAQGRSPAPASPVPGYRSAAQAPSARPAPAAARPAGSAGADGRPGNADNRAAPAGAMKTNKRVLTVGNDILLKGEIATCDRLVIEGMVDATLKDVHTVEISETGSFKGTAEIQDAEISGLFEGDLIVRNRLTIYSTGKVRGTISYGEIEIERGGQLTGEIRLGNDSTSAVKKTTTDKKDAA